MILLSLAAVVCSGCEEKTSGGVQVAPPPKVKVAVAEKRDDVITSKYFTGAVRESERVDIRARVQGYLLKIHFEDGAYVKQGQLLFEIEPQQYEARLEGAEAALLSARTALEEAEQRFQRGVAAGTAISVEDRETRRTQRDIAVAAVAEAKAVVSDASINLSYTKIHSPLTGRIGRRLVDAGNLVGADGNTKLTTVVARQPIQIYFEVSGPTVDRVQQVRKEDVKRGKMPRPEESDRSEVGELVIPIEAALTNDVGFPHKGKLDYLDFEVDSSTGTAMVRALLKNKDDLLFPGAFVRVRIPSPEPVEAVLIHDEAIGTNTQGRFVYLVVAEGGENIVKTRQVKRGELIGGMRVITGGLEGGESYIVEGVQRVRPDMPVNPQPFTKPPVSSGDSAEEATVIVEPPPNS